MQHANVRMDQVLLLGFKKEKQIFGEVTINEVVELEYTDVIGFTYELLETGEGEAICVVIHFQPMCEVETASFSINKIAYMKFRD